MAQLSRADGLLMFVVLGSFNDRPTCGAQLEILVANFMQSAEVNGRPGSLDMAACAPDVPRGSEFDALRHGTPTRHYVWFTPNMRAMFVHPKADREIERQMCAFFRGQMLSKLGQESQCHPPNG
jgi:hypothetical protein